MSLTAGKLYRRALSDHWLAYGLGVGTLLLTSTTEVLVPKFVQWALDIISNGSGARVAFLRRATRVESLHALAGYMLLALCFGWLGRLGWRQLLARRTHLSGRELKVRFWDVLRFQPLGKFQEYSLGDLMNRATGDWNASRAIHGFTLVMTLDLVFFTVLSITAMLTIDVELTLYCLAIFPLLPRLILRLARKEHDLHLYAQEKLGDLSGAVSQALSTIRLQRATNSDALWQRSLDRAAREYADRRFQVVRTGWRIFPLGAVPTLVAYAILLFWGVRKITHGDLSIGQFVALQSYVLMLQGPLFELGDCIAEWQRGFASLSRLVEIFNLQGTADHQLAKSLLPDLAAVGPAVTIDGLTFGYPGTGRDVLGDVQLAVLPGESVGIYGPLGSGKTTLLSLIAGLIEPPPGTVRVAGGDVHDVARAWMSRHVTMVPQRAFLFAGTLRYNLELDASFAEAELWDALELVQLADDVRAFPRGLDTWVGEWGITLSGGQKQRLALARALLRRRDVILLDDCLSAVDAVTEEEILRRLRARLVSTTVIWVAHRMSTLKLCDRIFRLEDRSLVEEAVRAPRRVAGAGPAIGLAQETQA